MNDKRYDYGNPNMAWGQMWPFIAPWMQAWACAMTAFVPGAVPPGAWGQAWTSPRGAASPKVSVRVSSQQYTEVSACVEPGAEQMRLVADPLASCDDKDAPSLKGVDIECQSGCVRVSVTVPHDQPAGVYRGAIRDATGCQRGELTVDIAKRGSYEPKSAV